MEGGGGEGGRIADKKDRFLALKTHCFRGRRRTRDELPFQISHPRNRSIFPDRVALYDFSTARNTAVYKCSTFDERSSLFEGRGKGSKFEGSGK